MSLTRRALGAMGIESEKIDQIIELHSETVDGLKSQISEYKSKSEKMQEMSKELEELKKVQGNPDEYKEKYESEKQAFESFKKNIEAEKVNSSKDKAYRQLLSDNHIKSNKIDLIMRTVNLNDLKLGEDNKLENSAEINKSILEDWSDFIETTEVQGTQTATPPTNGETVNEYSEQIRKFREALGLPTEK